MLVINKINLNGGVGDTFFSSIFNILAPSECLVGTNVCQTWLQIMMEKFKSWQLEILLNLHAVYAHICVYQIHIINEVDTLLEKIPVL